MTFAQIAAVVVFVAMFICIIIEQKIKVPKHIITLSAAVVALVFVFVIGIGAVGGDWGTAGSSILKTLNVESIFKLDFWYAASEAESEVAGINWATIIFIAGMMVMVEGMAHAGFFKWLCMTLAKAVKYKVVPLFISFMVLSSVLAMFIDSITVILFLAAVTIELATMLKFDPLPMILSEIFCANLGGSATMCGDPPNIIIGTALGLSFFDFLTNTGLIMAISLVAVVIFFSFAFRKDLKKASESSVDTSAFPAPTAAISSWKNFTVSCVIFGAAVIMLVTHSMTGLTVAFIGVVVALATILTSLHHIKDVLKGVDYKTLLFFIGLFVVVGGLEQTGVLVAVANFIENVSGGNIMIMIAIIIWVSGIASAVVDNIPFSATMVPVIQSIAATAGIDLHVLAWALAMGTDVGGSATPIGASANVVGLETATKAGHKVSWGKYCKTAIPATIIVLIISTITIYVRYL
ncbi:MAG: SLC13 family permease [Oscillospiraceae bacterium]